MYGQVHAYMHAQLCPALCDPTDYIACQTPLSMGFPRQEYWRGLPFPPPGNLPDPGIELLSPVSPALQADSLPLNHQGRSHVGKLVLNSSCLGSLLLSIVIHNILSSQIGICGWFRSTEVKGEPGAAGLSGRTPAHLQTCPRGSNG